MVFHPLDPQQIKQIAKIQINSLAERLSAMDHKIVISDDALSLLAESGYDPVYGARPLKRSIQQKLENPLAEELLSGKFSPAQEIKIDRDGDKLTIN